MRDLVERLRAARDAAAAVAGEAPLGVRAVEPAAGRRAYLAAFPGPAFLCLDERLAPEADRRRAHEAASASLLWEHVEALVDPDALRDLASAIGRLLALGGDPPEVTGPLETVAARALELAAWREDPMRAVASLPDIDEGAAVQERLVGAYARFMRASEPLVGRAGHPARDAGGGAARRGGGRRAGRAPPSGSPTGWPPPMPECEDGAGQMLAADVPRGRGGP